MIKSVPALAFRSALLFSFLAAPFAVFSGMGITVIFILFSLPLLPLAIKKYGAVVAAKSIAPPVSLFFLWIIITCLWSPDYYNAAVLWVLVCLLMLLATISIRFLAEITEEQRQKIARFTLFGFLLAAMIYAEEIFSKGFLVSNFRELLAGGGKQPFSMDYLNRGICFFVLLFWPVTIAMQRICGKKSAIKNIILGLITLFIVTNLESLSATMGFVASGLVYLFFLTTKGRFIWLLKAGVLFALLAVPFLSYKISPKAIEVAYPALPETAVHRLYIWDFVAKKAAEKPFFGWGFNSSRAIPGGNESYVAKGTKGKDLLPLHPHNQLLQIWLELGIIGLGIFAWLLLYCIKSIENGNFSIATKSAGLALFSAYFVIGLFGFGIWQNWWLAAGFFALCLFVAASYSESLKKASAKAKN